MDKLSVLWSCLPPTCWLAWRQPLGLSGFISSLWKTSGMNKLVPKVPSHSDASGPVLVKDIVTEQRAYKTKRWGGTKAGSETNRAGHMVPLFFNSTWFLIAALTFCPHRPPLAANLDFQLPLLRDGIKAN